MFTDLDYKEMLKKEAPCCAEYCTSHNFETFLVTAASQIKFVFNILYVGVPRLLTIETYKKIRVFRFSGIFSNSAISLRVRARGKKYLSDMIVLEYIIFAC